MTTPRSGSGRQLGMAAGGLLVALGVGVLIGYATFSGSDPSDGTSDREVACADLERLAEGESFEELQKDGIGPNTFRLTAIGAHAMAEDVNSTFHEAGKELLSASQTLDAERGDKALADLRDLCADS